MDRIILDGYGICNLKTSKKDDDMKTLLYFRAIHK